MDSWVGGYLYDDGDSDTPMKNNSLPYKLYFIMAALWALAFVILFVTSSNRMLMIFFGVGAVWFTVIALLKKRKAPSSES